MKIEELIDRYFEGQTSCEEERELRSFFTQENVPESLQSALPVRSDTFTPLRKITSSSTASNTRMQTWCMNKPLLLSEICELRKMKCLI